MPCSLQNVQCNLQNSTDSQNAPNIYTCTLSVGLSVAAVGSPTTR